MSKRRVKVLVLLSIILLGSMPAAAMDVPFSVYLPFVVKVKPPCRRCVTLPVEP